MISVAPKLTDAGMSLIVRSIGGEQITFTRFGIGNGELNGRNPDSLPNIINQVLEFTIESASSPAGGYVTLTGNFDNSAIKSDFTWTELGVFAKGEDGEEKLYAYANDGDNAGMLRKGTSDVSVEQSVSVIVAIGEAKNVTALVTPSVLYANKEAFEAHVANMNNPHKVTAAMIGLGNVQNVSTNDQTPMFTVPENTATQEIVSGETMSTLMGKIARAIMNLISHIANVKNPHKVTADQAGAAKKTHSHSATDINGGILGLARGGTGVSTLAELQKLIGGQIKIGSYTGDGSGDRSINLGYTPDALLLARASATSAMPSPQCYFLTKDIQVFASGHSGHAVGSQTWDASCSILMIDANGFKVDTTLNKNSWTYVYAAIKVVQ